MYLCKLVLLFLEMNNYITINDAVACIKKMIEDSIRNGGEAAKNNLIRSQQPINLLHNATKASFIDLGVKPEYIHPPYGSHNGELKLAGFFKFKDQDVCLRSSELQPTPEILSFDGILKGKKDIYGKELTEKILSVNVRSQLSSLAKNFDTLYERTYAEALNLHLRCPKMVLGELYMIPVLEYDDNLARNNQVGFKLNRRIQSHIEKYLFSFGAINNRVTSTGEEYKYEKVCLLIVDFSQSTPVIYNTDEELREAGLISDNTTASIEGMNFSNFCSSLLSIYQDRFDNSLRL